jgi:hypothetical protein
MKRASTWCVGLLALVALTTACGWNYYPPLAGTMDLHVVFDAPQPGAREPLIVTGQIGAGDFLYVRHMDDGTAVFGYDCWGRGGPESPPVQIQRGFRHSLRIEQPSFGFVLGSAVQPPERLRVTFEGQRVIDAVVESWIRKPQRVWFGRNPLGGSSCGPEFHGRLFRPDGQQLSGAGRDFATRAERLLGWFNYGRWQVAMVLLGAFAIAWSWARFRDELTWMNVSRGTRTLSHAIAAHRAFLATGAVCAMAFAAMVSWGTFRMLYPETLSAFYDFQALSLMQGRLDVPAGAIGSEAFLFGGKSYGYFGPTPALLRLPFVIFGVAFAELTRVAMLVYFIGCLVAAYLLLIQVTSM